MIDRLYIEKEQKRKKLRLDPRTKILLTIIISIFVLGGAGGKSMYNIRIFLSLLPVLLLLSSWKIKQAFLYILFYTICYLIEILFLKKMTGILYFIIIIITGTVGHFLPAVTTANYLLTTTTVSEFIAAMGKMKISKKIVIPLSVMFRFFPTIKEENKAISDAMKMRGIKIGGTKPGKILEYRIIPMIISSVKIGDDLSAAALTRGLGAPEKRTNICKVGFRIVDIIIISLSILTIIIYLFFKFSK